MDAESIEKSEKLNQRWVQDSWKYKGVVTDVELMGYGGDLSSMLKRYGDRLPSLVKQHRYAFTELQRFHDKDTRVMRSRHKERMSKNWDIDTSGDHWQQWVEMGS